MMDKEVEEESLTGVATLATSNRYPITAQDSGFRGVLGDSASMCMHDVIHHGYTVLSFQPFVLRSFPYTHARAHTH